MSRLYLLIWGMLGAGASGWDAERKLVLDFLNTRNEISTWHTCFRDGVLILSAESLDRLTAIVHEEFPNARFLILRVAGEQQGYLLPDSWEFIKKYQKL